MQAYNNELQSSEALYIAIISGSAVFLYLEFIQCFRGWALYFKYVINWSPLCFPVFFMLSRRWFTNCYRL
jgi:hypothetical protein